MLDISKKRADFYSDISVQYIILQFENKFINHMGFK